MNAEFVWRMEDLLDLYASEKKQRQPKVCFDETNKQLVKETAIPLPIRPGQPLRYDHEYERNGTRNLFLFFCPDTGWRHVKVTDRRTSIDFAHCMADLVFVHFPNAEKIHIICDNLNTHSPASLYKAFQPAKAKRILDKLEFHYTPNHGSWLNMAEIEFSVLKRQCLSDRIPDEQTLRCEVGAWEQERNEQHSTVNWQFTVADARTKLSRLYPL